MNAGVTTGETLVDVLAKALEQTGTVIAATRPDQAGLPTPCGSWDLRTLVNHIVYDARMFADTSQGLPRPPAGEDLTGNDWGGAFDAASADLIAVWRRPGATEGTISLPQGEIPRIWRVGQHLANFAVHAWDVAKASGQSTDLDPEVGRTALEWGRENIRPEFRGEEANGKVFGFEVPVPVDAPLYDRLAGFFGRDPSVDYG